MKRIKILAPAKLNLHLEITSKRDDGYHNLISLFQMISLYDEIFIEYTTKNTITVNGNFNFSVEENLIYKAADWLKNTMNITGGFDISCIKNIPSGAGLGGGSSDAAATILGIKSLLKLDIENAVLHEGALALGSDVPFFLGSGTAVVQGRGENLYPVASRKDLFVLVSDTGIHSSTKEAFSMLKNDYNKNDTLSKEEITNAYLNEIPSQWPYRNTFAPYLNKKYTIYREIIDQLNINGSEFSSVTGTGSSVFGVFGNEQLADKAKKVLKNSNIVVHKVKMLANRPQPVYN